MPRRASFPALRDRADDGIARHSLAGRRVNRGQNPGDWTWDLGIEFVCGDLEQRFVAFHALADALEPSHDRCRLRLVSELRHDDGHNLIWMLERFGFGMLSGNWVYQILHLAQENLKNVEDVIVDGMFPGASGLEGELRVVDERPYVSLNVVRLEQRRGNLACEGNGIGQATGLAI